MTTITRIESQIKKELAADFNMKYDNVIMYSGHYCLKLFLDENDNFRYICLLKKFGDSYDIVFTVPVEEAVTHTKKHVQVKFTVLNSDLKQDSHPTSIN